MQITIDTSKDSTEDIRKAIKLLTELIGESGSYGSSVDSQENTAAFNSMFGGEPISNSENSVETKEDVEEEIPKVQIVGY